MFGFVGVASKVMLLTSLQSPIVAGKFVVRVIISSTLIVNVTVLKQSGFNSNMVYCCIWKQEKVTIFHISQIEINARQQKLPSTVFRTSNGRLGLLKKYWTQFQRFI